MRQKVHVLGLGGIGTFAAHNLLDVPQSLQPCVTLLLHRPSLMSQYATNKSRITLTTREGQQVDKSGYQLELLHHGRWHRCSDGALFEEQVDVIQNLVVSVKATQTVSALRPLKHRLNASSHILFLQNGSGMIEKTNRELFTDERTRPNHILGVISHGVTLNSPFNITHTGFAATSIGSYSPTSEVIPSITASDEIPYLLKVLPLAPRFNATAYPFLDVFQIQLEKLAVNAFCNPLCALNDAKNGFLFTLPKLRRALLTEISRVICALPELRDASGVSERFSVDRLEATVNKVLHQTAETTCSMVVDLRNGSETEIHFINGYWCRRGREVGVPTPLNDELIEKITKKEQQRIFGTRN